jgi:hypothetical protein
MWTFPSFLDYWVVHILLGQSGTFIHNASEQYAVYSCMARLLEYNSFFFWKSKFHQRLSEMSCWTVFRSSLYLLNFISTS